MNIIVLKLVTGEELIAEKTNQSMNIFGTDTNNNFKLKRTRVLQMMQTQNGVGFGLVPWLMSAPDSEVDINSNHVISCINAPSDIEKAYLQQVSGLQLTQTLHG